MPRFLIERQYLVPVYQHIAVEADSIEAACKAAVDSTPPHDDWSGNVVDWEQARETTVTMIVPNVAADADPNDINTALSGPKVDVPPEFRGAEAFAGDDLDSAIRGYCSAKGLRVDGDLFGALFSVHEAWTAKEIAKTIDGATFGYDLNRLHRRTPITVEAFAEAPYQTTWGEFADANKHDVAEVSACEVALLARGKFVGGGGSTPAYSVALVPGTMG